ncbi:hypothetical protein BOW39_04305 [Solemya velum gill symbiont]|uniref:LamG-like jellyroll fold domain-containing protein n=1 Tax=Solemya velum gill symbiont TaxID=2340 RepID=UPI0009976EE1|nr:LamG-like jellyroll fold domain-containing protein [Solemya velum gill symbiont]OOZ49929.1 hypothetical protein BOW39_04305 [Solemya velum gill symbiont]
MKVEKTILLLFFSLFLPLLFIPSVALSQSNALDFDGTDDRLLIPGGAGSVFDFQASDFTIELWIKTPLPGVEQTLVYAQNSMTSDMLRLSIDAAGQSSFFLDLGGKNAVVTHPTALVADTWHHIAVVRFSNDWLNIYVDGIAATKQRISRSDGLVDLDQDIAIGHDYTSNPSSGLANFFSGQMDELRFWSMERSEAEIQDAAGLELLGNEPGLAAYYDFNQGVAEGDNSTIFSVTDRTTNGKHAVLYSFSLSGSSSNFVEKSGTVSELAPACEIGEALFPMENSNPGGIGGWTATASSVSTAFGGGWDAGHMIDNRVNTYWLSETNTLDSDHFITVDMDSTQTIAGLQYFYSDENSDAAIEEFEVLTSTDGVNFNVVTTGQLVTDVEAIAQHIVFDSEVSARYYRLKSTSPDRLHVGGAELSPLVCAARGEHVIAFTLNTCEADALNSGYDLATGTAFDAALDRYDMQWHVAQIDSTTNTLDAANGVAAWQKAVVIGNVQGNWFPPSSTAEWIGISHSGSNSRTVEHLYRLDFDIDLPHQDYLNTLKFITFDFYSDNGIYDILVNGNSLKDNGYLNLRNNKNHTGYSATTIPVSWSMDPDHLRVGTNTLILHVKSVGNYTGLLADLSPGSSCTAIDVGSAPEAYGTKAEAPVHFIKGTLLYIGSSHPNPSTGDDHDGLTLTTYAGSGKVTASLTGKNATGAPAMLCGYLDGAADGVVDGRFSKGMTYTGSVGDGVGDTAIAGNEEVCIQVSGNSGFHSLTLAAVSGFNGADADCTTQVDGVFSCDLHFYPNFTVATQTYTRFRLTSDSEFFSTNSPAPTGPTGDGEVEDQELTITPTAAVIGSVSIGRVPVDQLVEQSDASTVMALLESYGIELESRPESSLAELLLKTLDPDGDGSVALVRWTTLEELGTVGFYLDRREAGGDEWVRINNKMLPGLIDAPFGGEYLYADPGAMPDVDYLYKLTEQEAWGSRQEYGPYQLSY